MAGEQIAKLLQKIAKGGKDIQDFITTCTVKSIDGNTCVCQPVDDGLSEIVDVKLVSESDDTNFIIVPAVNSVVTVIQYSDNENTEYAVIMFSKIDSIKIRGDQYSGLVKVEDLVTKINALENLVNGILNTLKSTTILLAPSGTYPFAPLYAALSDITPITNKSDLENQNIKHG